jgi:hypothetical protein
VSSQYRAWLAVTVALKTFTAFAEMVKSELQETWRRERFDYLVHNAGTGVYKIG